MRRQPLEPQEKVRVFHPVHKKTIDVQIVKPAGKPHQKSLYKVIDKQGKTETLDFNKICWDYGHFYHAKRARIEDGKIHVVNHTIIHPRFHNSPDILKAKEAELENHKKFGTFKTLKESELSPQQRAKIIPSTWSVIWKGTEASGRYKARLCARGDREPNVEEVRTDAPTAGKDYIRLLLTIASSFKWKMHSCDFQAAFLQGQDIDRELYMRPPADIRRKHPDLIYKIVKRLYGLKDSSRGWILEVRQFLLDCGMSQSAMDQAVFFSRDKSGKLEGMIVTHVDDFLFAGCPKFHSGIIQKVLDHYVIGAREDTNLTFTGWQLSQDQKGITLSQQDYQGDIKLDDFQGLKTYTNKSEDILGESEQTLYRRMIGIINWLAGSSKPGLSHISCSMSKKLGKATGADARAVLRVLEKAKQQLEVLKFSNLGDDPSKWELEVFADAALGKNSDPDAYIGDICFLKGPNGVRNVVNWQATKLAIPTASILNAEAEAASGAHGKIKYLRFIFNELFGCQPAATIYTDSKSLFSAVNSDNSIRNRRISAAIATIRALKMHDNTNIQWIKGLANIADCLTRPNSNLDNLRSLLSTGLTLDKPDAHIQTIDYANITFDQGIGHI